MSGARSVARITRSHTAAFTPAWLEATSFTKGEITCKLTSDNHNLQSVAAIEISHEQTLALKVEYIDTEKHRSPLKARAFLRRAGTSLQRVSARVLPSPQPRLAFSAL